MIVNDYLSAAGSAGVVSMLVGALAKGTAILIAGSICVLLARGASAAARHFIWTLTLTGALIAPVASVFVPTWSVPVPRWSVVEAPATAEVAVPAGLGGASSNVVFSLSPRTPSGAPSVTPSVTPSVAEPAVVPVVVRQAPVGDVVSAGPATSAPEAHTRTTPAAWEQRAGPVRGLVPERAGSVWRVRILPWLVALWAVGAVIAIIPCVVGLARLSTVTRRARVMRGGRWALLVPSVMRELDVRRRVRFVELDESVMPMTWGVFRPVVLLPADDFDSTIEQRLDVLRHELAHVRRYDCLTQLVAQLTCALHWFNPLVWMAAAQLRAERERACDDEVLRAGSRASDYADYLLRVARSTRMVGAAALGGLAMARPSQMAGRLMAVLDDRRPRGRVSGPTSVQATLMATLIVVATAALAPAPANARGAIHAPTVLAHLDTGGVSAVAPAVPAVVAVEAVAAMPAIAPTASVVSIAASSAPASVPALSLVATAPMLPALPVPPAASLIAVPCGRNKGGTGEHSSSTSITTDDGSKRWRVKWSQGDCSFEMDARGEFKWNRDVTDIESISSGGSFTVEQRDGDDTRRLVIRPSASGSLDRAYTVNGAKAEYDDAARAWFADALLALERQTAFAVDQRVPALLARGGVESVLQETTLLGSDYARRRYYTKLLSLRQLDRAQVRRVVEQAGSEMSSDYELAELLVAMAKLDAFGDDSHAAFVSASKKIESDYERRRALNALLQRDGLAPTTVQALLDAAGSIGSDYELATLLIDVSKRYAMNDQTRPAYIKALGSIESDYEHRRVLATIVVGGGLTPAITRTLLDDAKRISSDYELAEFLIQIAKKGVLDASTRDAYFAAADKIDSDYEHHRALSPLLVRGVLTSDLAKAILASAAKIESDYECASLLVELAKVITIDESLRPSYERAAGTLESDSEYGRAMAAVRRSVTR
jgi:beta-lactamase regulating signal transducer with metallopeptidase domain